MGEKDELSSLEAKAEALKKEAVEKGLDSKVAKIVHEWPGMVSSLEREESENGRTLYVRMHSALSDDGNVIVSDRYERKNSDKQHVREIMYKKEIVYRERIDGNFEKPERVLSYKPGDWEEQINGMYERTLSLEAENPTAKSDEYPCCKKAKSEKSEKLGDEKKIESLKQNFNL